MVGRMNLQDLDAMLGPDKVCDYGSPKRQKMYERAFARCEPHHAHKADIVDLADEISLRWFRRAVRFGDSLLELNRLYAIPDSRS